ncbi:hypothetical protein ASF56_04565 [Methylobacterium sp. Leaf122]|nr:hypothetical protein [Methylobacterium sp. Leaf122]KQQ12443.1 hypothetical protein ASF56_04565 [Methylobacterium sp. Leaf122]
MLSLPGFDKPRLAGLRVRIQDMAVRQNRYRREARSIGVPADCPETHRLVQAAEQDTAALADLERLVSLTMRFMADEQSGRPADADVPSPSGRNLLARAFAALTGAPSRNGGVS